MEAEKNIFGQYKLYKSPVLSDQEVAIVLSILDGISNSIQAQISEEEILNELKNRAASLQWVVNAVNAYLSSETFKVDGNSMAPILDTFVNERLDAIRDK